MTTSIASHDRNPWQRGLVNGSTDDDYPSIIPTTTEPATVDSGTPTANVWVAPCAYRECHLMFIGTGADNRQSRAKVALWRRVTGGADGTTILWVATTIGEFDFTVSSTLLGVAGSPIVAADLIADTVAEVGSTWHDGLVQVKSPADNTPATIRIKTIGFEKIAVYWDIGAASGTAVSLANILFSFSAGDDWGGPTSV